MSEFAKEQKKENRREVYKYIEVIVNTRMHGTGYPVQVKELLVLTKLPENTLKTTLKWLIRHGLVESVAPNGYLPLPIPSKGLCWMHGRYYEGYKLSKMPTHKRNQNQKRSRKTCKQRKKGDQKMLQGLELIINQTQGLDDQELQKLLEKTEYTLTEAVEMSGHLNKMISALEKKNNSIKDFIKTHDFEVCESDHYTASLTVAERIKIAPVKMLKYLKDKGQTNLVDAVMDVKITEVRKYLGDVIVETLGKPIASNTKTLYIKAKK